jgi:lysophospholipase L1-like esterase
MLFARTLLGALVVCVLSVGCSKPKEDSSSSSVTVASAAVSSAAPKEASSVAAVTPSPAPAPAEAPKPKKYARVLHTGDSMVGGGLALALRPKFEAEGTKYHRDVIESGTIHEFSQNDHLPGLLAKVKPDLVLLTLGANHIPNSIDPEKEIGPFIPKLIKRVAGIDCYWVAPPIWKPSQAKFNEWLSQHVAPCRWYDVSARGADIARRPDKIHPNEKGGEVWADDFWKFFKGEGAFAVDGAPSTSTSLGIANGPSGTPAGQLLLDAGSH